MPCAAPNMFDPGPDPNPSESWLTEDTLASLPTSAVSLNSSGTARTSVPVSSPRREYVFYLDYFVDSVVGQSIVFVGTNLTRYSSVLSAAPRRRLTSSSASLLSPAVLVTKHLYGKERRCEE
jgi:hypothetical protein